MLKRKIPKRKKGAWYVKVSGSYLPASWQGILLHLLLLVSGIALLIMALNDDRPIFVVIVSFVLELIGLGAVFTWAASRKA